MLDFNLIQTYEFFAPLNESSYVFCVCQILLATFTPSQRNLNGLLQMIHVVHVCWSMCCALYSLHIVNILRFWRSKNKNWKYFPIHHSEQYLFRYKSNLDLVEKFPHQKAKDQSIHELGTQLWFWKISGQIPKGPKSTVGQNLVISGIKYPKLHILRHNHVPCIFGSEVMVIGNSPNFPENFRFLNKYDRL